MSDYQRVTSHLTLPDSSFHHHDAINAQAQHSPRSTSICCCCESIPFFGARAVLAAITGCDHVLLVSLKGELKSNLRFPFYRLTYSTAVNQVYKN